jgi:hypothetical protein
VPQLIDLRHAMDTTHRAQRRTGLRRVIINCAVGYPPGK